MRNIDDTDESFLSSLSQLELEKRIYPVLQQSNHFILKYGAPLRRDGNTSVVLEQRASTGRRFDYVDDTGTTRTNCFWYEQAGILHIARRSDNGALSLVKQNIGSVNTETGLITITNFIPDAIESCAIDLRLRVLPAVNDFTPTLNQLYTIDDTAVRVLLLNDATATLSEQTAFFAGEE